MRGCVFFASRPAPVVVRAGEQERERKYDFWSASFFFFSGRNSEATANSSGSRVVIRIRINPLARINVGRERERSWEESSYDRFRGLWLIL